MTRDPVDEAIVRAAVTLGHALDIEVVAEGVETAEIRDAVRGLECDLIQGYLVARPMGAGRLGEWLAGRAG